MDVINLNAEHKRHLLELARGSIRRGLEGGGPVRPLVHDYDSPLRAIRAVFTTLTLEGRLRGCIGTTEALSPLVTAVADSAYSAAFRDPRFTPLPPEEYAGIEVSLSLLTPAEPLAFESERGLLAQIRPGLHGLTIAAGGRKATFLPSVWEQITAPEEFLLHLKHKAGLAADQSLEQAWVYTTLSIREETVRGDG